MHTEKLDLSDIRYNPERGAFEAIVRLHDGDETFDYPTQLRAPMGAEFGFVSARLSDKACRTHRSPEPGLRLRKADYPFQTAHRTASQPPEMPLMVRMLRAFAA